MIELEKPIRRGCEAEVVQGDLRSPAEKATRRVALVAMLLSAIGCVGSEVTMIGPARPARPAGCAVTVLPGKQPAFPIVDMATARAECHAIMGRIACIDELRRQACAVGADVVYGFSESVDDSTTFISATLAYRVPSVRQAAPPAAATPAPGDCEPPCSPGFACQAGTCIPQCNPTCDTGEVCNRHRSCEPAASAAHP